MSLGRTPAGADLFRNPARFCAEWLSPNSIYSLLHRDGGQLFPDEEFADLFQKVGRDCVPPRIVATVMVLQRLEGLSDREAVDRFAFDLRWKYAAGGLDFDYPGFVHTVLVDMRARLRRSERPNRVFDRVLEVARGAGLVGRRRVLDSTPLYDAVATQDTVTMIRSAIRQLLSKAGAELGLELRAALKRDDDYSSAGKPQCDWDDKEAREALIDALARDAYALLGVLDGRQLPPEVGEAARLLATVVGQDLEQTEEGLFRIARRVAADRVISVVDPQTRHGHKTAARGFDGYKGHVAVDPDSEIVTAVQVSPGNVGDGAVALALMDEVLKVSQPSDTAVAGDCDHNANRADELKRATADKATEKSELANEAQADSRQSAGSASEPKEVAAANKATETPKAVTELQADSDQHAELRKVEIYGDAAYGTAENIEMIEQAGGESFLKVQVASNRNGYFAKGDFKIDLEQGAVNCPNGERVSIRRRADGSGFASFGSRCKSCPLAAQCTGSKKGRTISIHAHEQTIEQQREKQRSPEWKREYRATRPKVERKLGHMMFRRHGGRRARVRGLERVGQDFSILAAAINLHRLAVLGIRFVSRIQGWEAAMA